MIPGDPGQPAAFPSFTVAQVDEVIAAWGAAQSETMRNESRASLASDLFDIRGRTWVGFECYYEAAAPLLQELVSRSVPPEEIGRRMKVPGSRPYYLQLFLLMSNYLGSREERVLQHGTAPDMSDPAAYEQLRVLVEFFTRTTMAYRNDGAIVPGPPENDQRILGEAWVARCVELLGPPTELEAIKRMSAMLSLYSFMLHGEQRDGQFDHGPYPGPDGTQIIVREFNDLRNTYLPWSEREARLPYSNVCVAYACRGASMRFTIFATATTSPADLAPHVEGVAAFARVGEELHRLDAAEMATIATLAQQLQLAIYRRVVRWDAIERSRYGLYLYANSLAPFLTVAGCDDLVADMTSRFEEIGNRVACELTETGRRPLVLDYFGVPGDGPLFTPPRSPF
jgi:hypothetical protein